MHTSFVKSFSITYKSKEPFYRNQELIVGVGVPYYRRRACKQENCIELSLTGKHYVEVIMGEPDYQSTEPELDIMGSVAGKS